MSHDAHLANAVERHERENAYRRIRDAEADVIDAAKGLYGTTEYDEQQAAVAFLRDRVARLNNAETEATA